MKRIRRVISIITGVFVFGSSFGSEYYVSPAGNDNYPGTIEKPFQSISHAVKILNPGDTLNIRQGVYQESVILEKSGTEDDPITIQAYGLEYVEISGVKELTQEWELYDEERQIYVIDLKKTKLGKEIAENNFQLFIDKQSFLNARWPNCRYDELLTRKGWQKVGVDSRYGVIDASALKETDMDIEGADIYLNVIHQFFTWNRKVTEFEAETGILRYPANLNLGSMFFEGWWARKGWKDDYFYLEGKYDFLDFPGEFFFDPATGKLFAIPPEGKDLNESLVEHKTRIYGLRGHQIEHVNILGIQFFGTAMSLTNCQHMMIDGCTFRFPINTRELQESVFENMGIPNQYKQVHNRVTGQHNTLRNLYGAHASGSLLNVSGQHNLIENAILHDACYSGSLYYKCLSFGGKNGGTVRRSTIFNAGNVGIHFGGPNVLVELNHVFNTGMVSHDVSAIYTSGDRAKGCRITRNWVHDNPAWIGGIGIRGDDLTRGLTVDHNVIWNIGQKGIVVKGDHNSVFNNTVFSVRELSMLLPDRAEPKKDWQIRAGKTFLDRQNANTLYANNMVGNQTSDKKTPSEPVRVAYNEGNLVTGQSPPPLQDIARYNFHPLPSHEKELMGAPIPETAVIPVELDPQSQQPYVGAYGFDGEDWKPGAINGIHYQFLRKGDQYVLKFKYILPLVEDDAISILINGKEVKAGVIRKEKSFRSLPFFVDPSLLKKKENQIQFQSKSFGWITSTYDLTEVGDIQSGYFPESDLFNHQPPIQLLYTPKANKP